MIVSPSRRRPVSDRRAKLAHLSEGGSFCEVSAFSRSHDKNRSSHVDTDIIQRIGKRAIELSLAEGRRASPNAEHWRRARREIQGDVEPARDGYLAAAA